MADQEWTLITVTYNSAADLRANWSTRDFDYRWIVVDNGSSDDTVEVAFELADSVIESGTNDGFSRANNIGLASVETEYVAFVNPDVLVSGASWQTVLRETVDRTRGIVAPQLLNWDGGKQPNARGWPYLNSKIRNRISPGSARGREYARTGFVEPTYCAWAMGAAIAARTETIRVLGGWDESYFLYYEDHELGMRAWQHGIPVVLEPRVEWVHGWARDTARLNFSAWQAEVRSMRTFYGQHPDLLFDRRTTSYRRLRSSRYGSLSEVLWKSAATNQAFEDE